MGSRVRTFVLLPLLLLGPGIDSASGSVRRFVLATGANSGGPDRVPLRYAVSDASGFAEVMTKMGGVDPADRWLLRNPGRDEFARALAQLQARVAGRPETDARTEVLFYFSGHADEEGLLFGAERLSYRELREMMDGIASDVRITVLDACASGAITRIKGGQRRQAFLVDDSSDMRGYAFLTSSSANEAAQESDQIGSSFFTHYLVSGMRGAADVSGDGKVSLTEAYDFAFHETLSSTTETLGGAQHPVYEINLSGTGDVVMTDVRETSAGILLTEELAGRFFIRNADRQLVVELYKPPGRSIEIGLEPGTYKVYLAQEEQLLLGSSKLRSGDRLTLRSGDFRPCDRESTVSRGGRPGGEPGLARDRRFVTLAGRTRLEFGVGMWSRRPREGEVQAGNVVARTGTDNLTMHGGLAHWVQENRAVGISVAVLSAEANSAVGEAVSNEELAITRVLLEVQNYLSPGILAPSFRPCVTVGVGSFIASLSRSYVNGPAVTAEARTLSAFVARIGVGLDVPLSRRFLLGARAALNGAADFAQPVGGRKNYSGFETGIGISLLLGGGPRP